MISLFALRAHSSVGERLTHIQEVAGSKPAGPTKKNPCYQIIYRGFAMYEHCKFGHRQA